MRNNTKHWELVTQFDLKGEHDQKTSINYSYNAKFGNLLEVESSVRITFTLISGKKFQINGMALCSRD